MSKSFHTIAPETYVSPECKVVNIRAKRPVLQTSITGVGINDWTVEDSDLSF